MFVIYETSTGRAVSFGTIIADPLPAGLTSLALTAPEAQGVRDGSKLWDAATRTVIDRTPTVREANESTINTQITAALVELGTLIAAPAVATVPAGTLTTAQLSNAMRDMRTAVQANREGAQTIAATLKRTIRLVRGDFDDVN